MTVEEDKAARRSSVGWWKEGLRGSLRGLFGSFTRFTTVLLHY